MNMNAQVGRWFEIGILAGLTFAPLGIWYVLSVVDECRSLNFELIILWIRALRWITYVCGVALFLANLTSAYFAHDIKYVCALLTFSAGLSMPQSWLKRKSSRVETGSSLDARAATKTERQ